jgi:acyl-[acyl carrier protein]--UDP-N-acetylglucosamine O-acyltransferase
VRDEAVIAAGSVVTRDIPPQTLVAGDPVRPIPGIGKLGLSRLVWPRRGRALFDVIRPALLAVSNSEYGRRLKRNAAVSET